MSKLYHKDVYMPSELIVAAMRHQARLNIDRVQFSRHMQDHFAGRDEKHLAEKEDILKALSNAKISNVVPFEVETEDNVMIKYCIRVPLNSFEDVAIAIAVRGDDAFIKTAWNNRRGDRHYTLDKGKYEPRP